MSKPKLTTSYWSHKYEKYIIIFEAHIPRSLGTMIARNLARKPVIKGFFKHELLNSYEKTHTYYTDEAIQIVKKDQTEEITL